MNVLCLSVNNISTAVEILDEQFLLSIDTDNVMKFLLVSLCFWLHGLLPISAESNDSCGQRNSSNWKWHVQLVNTNPTEQDLSCGGTLLNKLFVATAAHCLYDSEGEPLDVDQLRILLADGEFRKIRRTFQPKPFDIEHISNDFVLILLDREVKYNNVIGPACLPKPDEILPQEVYTPILPTGLSVNREEICLNDSTILFEMIHSDVICAGSLDRSHKYHRNAGSGMFVEHGSKWYLVGLVMYTTGPTEIHITYIGGIRLENYLKWIRTTMDYYSETPSIIEKKCQEYMDNLKLPFPEHYPIVKLSVGYFHETLCHGSLISPRFVLTTAQCAAKTEQIFIGYVGFVKQAEWIEPMQGKIALIELDRDFQIDSRVLVCLYSSSPHQDTANYTTWIAYWGLYARLRGIQIQYRINTPLHVLNFCSFGHSTMPGDAIVVKNDNEGFYRMIGMLDDTYDCEPFEREKASEAINVEIYLPWIQDLVWGSAMKE